MAEIFGVSLDEKTALAYYDVHTTINSNLVALNLWLDISKLENGFPTNFSKTIKDDFTHVCSTADKLTAAYKKLQQYEDNVATILQMGLSIDAIQYRIKPISEVAAIILPEEINSITLNQDISTAINNAVPNIKKAVYATSEYMWQLYSAMMIHPSCIEKMKLKMGPGIAFLNTTHYYPDL